LPLGNLTSQLFANVYLNELDQFVKQKLLPPPLTPSPLKGGRGRAGGEPYYARYTDDFIVVSGDKKYLETILLLINNFLENELHLELHPDKVFIRKFSQGIDFLGYVARPYQNLVRTKTKRRIFKRMKKAAKNLAAGKIKEDYYNCLLKSYLGVLSHADAYE
jgi:RNA-directed DNA polymerase